MLPRRLSFVLFLGGLLPAVIPRVDAAGKVDLRRVTPVPASEPIPVADFFRPPLFADPRLNLSGTHIAALITAGDDRVALGIYEIDTQKMEALHGQGDRDIHAPVWLDDQRLLFSLATEKFLGEGVYAVDVGRLGDSYPLVQYCAVNLVGVPEKDRRQPLYWLRSDLLDGTNRGVVALDTSLDLGRGTNLRAAGTDRAAVLVVRERNERHFVRGYPKPEGGLGAGYLADRNGELAFAFTAKDGVATLHRYVADHWERCPVDLDAIDVIASGENPGELVVRGPRRPGQPRALQVMDAATGRLGDTLYEDPRYDFSGRLYRHPVTHAIVGLRRDAGGPQAVWFTEEYRRFQKLLDGLFPGRMVSIIGSNRAQSRFLVIVYSDRQPPVYYRVDIDKRTFSPVRNSAPWIDPARMRPMSVMRFTTRDGRELDAFVTLPAGASRETPAPLVVLPHGGPFVRDSWGFDPEAQFLASRGYAVLQPNYRGSPGCDWMFPADDRFQFQKMGDDVTDATRALLKSGPVDPRRVAIMGGSFGGYLAVSGVVHEPDLYRCAVTIAGIFDWEEVMKDREYYQSESPSYAWLKRRLGDPDKQKEFFDSISPVRHVDRIRVPVFIAHGKDDPVAKVSESRRLISALKECHVPHEAMLVAREGHGFGYLTNQVELYKRIEAFLARNLAPAAPAPAAPAPAATPAPAPATR